MEKMKFTLFFIVTVAILVLLGYWAYMTLEPASLVVEKQKQEALQEQNDALTKEVADLKEQLRVLEASQPAEETPTETPTPTPTTPKPTPTTTNKNQSLIDSLEKLIDDKIYMKLGSSGTRVGTVQTFLNLYNNTKKTVDNDYGPGTKTDVMNFQKAVGISADGEAGPGTYAKMIEWLKKQ